jgi:hypothetical protein
MRCAYCHDELAGAARTCPGCATQLHPDCAAALGGTCPTLGCPDAPVARPRKPYGPLVWLAALSLLGPLALLIVVGLLAATHAEGPSRFPVQHEGVIFYTQAAPDPPRPLAHVKAGQRYVFALEGGVQEVWRVREVGPDRVAYTVHTYAPGHAGGDPRGQERMWYADAIAPMRRPEGATEWREGFTVSGVTFEAWVVEENGARVWVATTEGTRSQTFPGQLRRSSGGTVHLELVRIDPPWLDQAR